ncbi:MAG: arginase family protein [Deltaproteobacteria bacterium]|nr:arginase family protein [Deltaproteobacteria bacterium]
MSGPLLVLNPATEIGPADEGAFDVKVVALGTSVRATRYQVGLLQHFAELTTQEAVLARFPFSKADSIAFLDRCQQRGVLVEKDPDGRLRLPDRVAPKGTTMLASPSFDPKRPPAFCFLGMPYDGATSGEPGARFGPTSVRESAEGYRYQIDPITLEPAGFLDLGAGRHILRGVTLGDAGDVRVEPGEPQERCFGRLTRSIREIADAGSIPLVIGGDHAITYPILAALPVDDVAIVHFDAHTDFASYDGDLHHGNIFTVTLEKLGYVRRIHQFGLRGYVDPEPGRADPHVFRTGVDQLRRRGLELIDELPKDLPYYVSVDIDVLDPTFASSTGTPVPGGLFPHELKDLLFHLARAREILGADVVEVAASSGAADGTAHFALDALLAVAAGTVERILSEDEKEPTDE